MPRPKSRAETALSTILALIGNVDHTRGHGVNSARTRGDMLAAIRDVARRALESEEGDDMADATLRAAVRDHFESTLEQCEKTGNPAPYASRGKLIEAMRLAYDRVGLELSHPLLEEESESLAWETFEPDDFERGYVAALFFTERGDVEDGYAIPEDYGVEDLAPEALRTIREDCRAFREVAADLYPRAVDCAGYDAAQAGRDFWITRNGHGAGFWDRPQLDNVRPVAVKSVGEQLSALCGHGTAFPPVEVELGDDGLIHLR